MRGGRGSSSCLTSPPLKGGEVRKYISVSAAAEILRQGGIVAFPTETVYGLGADALNATAVKLIFDTKGRPATNPVIVHVRDAVHAETLCEWSDEAARLAEQFWPGPLTLVLPKKPIVPDIVTAGGASVAVRMPRHPVALELLNLSGLAIAAPSANRSTKLSPTRAEHIDLDVPIVDGGPCAAGIESTVYDVASGKVLRPGPIVFEARSADGRGKSPGQMLVHYRPRTPLLLVNVGDPLPVGTLIEELPPDLPPAVYEAMLYHTLHTYDARGVERLIIVLPPDEPAYAAVRDRLMRAGTISSLESRL